MKYVILDANGHKLPIIFPEALNHDFVASAMKLVVVVQAPKFKGAVTVFGAGFTDPLVIAVHGKSETLNIESKSSDLPYLALGSAIAHMPPDAAMAMFTAITGKKP